MRSVTPKGPNERWGGPGAVALFIALALNAPETTRATVHTIGSGSNVKQLQQVIDHAAPGDSVFVIGGTLEGDLRLEKRIALIGSDQPVIRGSGSGSVIVVSADSCLIRGFIVEHSGRMLVGEDAGILIRSDHNVVEKNHLRDVLFGIYLWDADDNRIGENAIAGRGELGVGERGSGIHIYNSHWNTFQGNIIWDVRDGFYIQYANHTVIRQCEVFHVRYGLHYMYADSNVFLRNNFHDNLAGAAIMYSKGIVMRGNVFRDNTGFSSYGILFQDCHDLEADSNAITDNTVGMFLEASTGNRFRHNLVARNSVALQMFQNSVGNTFSRNDFIDNLSPLAIVGRRTESHWSADGIGNYWSTYDGYDMDHDGIGDVPMRIVNVFQYLEGQNPAARLYLYSPASQALAFAAQSFPVFDRNEEIDLHPLIVPDRGGLAVVPGEKGRKSVAVHHWAVLPMAFLLFGSFVFYRVVRREE